MNDRCLFETLHVEEVDVAELDQLLLAYFQTAAQVSLTEIVYPGHEIDYAMKLTYGERGLIGVTRGPRLTDPDVETIKSRVETELLAPAGTRMGKEILFSHLPVKGYY